MSKVGESWGFEIMDGPVTMEGGVLKGVSTAVKINDDFCVILSAPDLVQLGKAFKLLSSAEFNEQKTSKVGVAAISRLELISVTVDNEDEEIWIVHPESECAFRGYRRDLEKDPSIVEVGVVTKGTELECKILLRGLGWSRVEIDSLNINDLGADEIPF